MPYSTWTKLKMPLDLDGSMCLYNLNGGASAAYSILGAADLAQLQGESPAKDTDTAIASTASDAVVMLFPELRDISGILIRYRNVTTTSFAIATSADTTNGVDGTWTTCTVTGTALFIFATALGIDWWRNVTPATIDNNTGVRAIRMLYGHTSTGSLRGFHVFGKKTSGQTIHDILFLDPDGSTVSTIDYDFGDVAAGGTTSDVTVYVKNASATLTANNIALAFAGSNTSDYLMSIDGGSNFFTTRVVTSLAPGATQAVVVRLTTPAIASGNATPRAANLRAAVGSWT